MYIYYNVKCFRLQETSFGVSINVLLKQNGYKVANNSKGSNLINGITSLFLRSTNTSESFEAVSSITASSL